jgi:superfamily II DNA helicase RecQ
MAFRFFTIPARVPEDAQDELNRFMKSHRILAVDRRWVDQGENSFWALCVDYLDSSGSPGAGGKEGGARNRVDYRETLDPESFAVFARLRELRKQIAQQEAVPIYMVFTNEQLAQMAQTRAATRSDLEKIAGVGDARIEKYAARFLDLIRSQSDGKGTTSDAPGRPTL